MQALEGKRKNVRSTAKQIQVLVEYMSSNPGFANGDFCVPLGGQHHEAEWRQLKALLAEKGPDKSVEQWKQGLVMAEQSASSATATSTATITAASTATRARPVGPQPSTSTASQFCQLQKETNLLLKNMIKLMEEKNEILREHNKILKRRYPSPTPEE